MNRNRTDRDRNSNEERESWSMPGIIGGVLGIAAAAAGGLYLYSRARNNNNQSQREGESDSDSEHQSTSRHAQGQGGPFRSLNSSTNNRRQDSATNMSGILSGLMDRLTTNDAVPQGRGVRRRPMPERPITNLNGLIDDIYVRYVALDDDDFEEYYGVMHKIFLELHQKMKDVDPYYRKYSSKVQFAGSHPDKLRINKPDEFDIDIVIGLPLCHESHPDPAQSDFNFEPKEPGFIQLKMGVQYDRLPFRDGTESCVNMTAYKWKDDKNYLLRSKFSDWFHSVVDRALNQFPAVRTKDGVLPVFRLNGVEYTINKSASGPAKTLYIENVSKGFKLDVDLVPALKFPIGRWPVCSGYRLVPPQASGRPDWMVVPKPNKGGATEHDKLRSWRVALHEQEAMLMHNTNHMRQAIRLIKKLRDAKGMDKIASYYIKTIFLLEAMDQDITFWNQSPVTIFKHMLKKFHKALVDCKIPYYWNKNNNLIGHVDKNVIRGYASIVGELVEILEKPAEYKKVAEFLLTPEEYNEYKRFLGM